MRRDKDEQFMAMCLRLAEKGRGFVSPNPLVGAVLVRNGRVVSHGYHHRFGGSHAEVECLNSYRGNFHGTTLYVNLEPCSHLGKTPPCANLIVDSGIGSVVVGMKDPNPLVSGRGIRRLRRAGVNVRVGVLKQQTEELNQQFLTHIVKRRPFIHVKVAQSLDGKIARRRASPTQITGEDSRRLVHRWRAEHDLVLVGVGTVNADDPLLTVRLADGRDPSIAILDGNLSLDLRSRVLKTATRRQIMLFVQAGAANRCQRKVQELTSRGVIVLPIEHNVPWLPLRRVLKLLYSMNVGSVLVEGGSLVFSQFLKEGLIDRLSVFVSPLILRSGVSSFVTRNGSDASSISLPRTQVGARKIGRDVLLQYDFA